MISEYIHQTVCGIKRYLIPLLAVGIWLLTLPANLTAQDNLQISITGIPAVLSDPFVDAIEQQYRSGRYQVQVNYSTTQQTESTFEFRLSLRRGAQQLIQITSDPVTISSGIHIYERFFREVEFGVTFEEAIAEIGGDRLEQIIRSGKLPEGSYTIRLEAEPVNQDPDIITSPGIATFRVRYPQPPVLMSPADQSMVTQKVPTFSWTPITGAPGEQFEYRILLVEMFEGQTPQRAIEANRVHMEQTITGRTTFPYTQEYLPLEEGKRYAWQITASDVDGGFPLSDEGKTEIQTFTYLPGGTKTAGLGELTSLTLVPGFAVLEGVGDLERREDPNAIVLNGRAQLELSFAGTGEEPVTLEAQVANLRIQKGSTDNPVIMGGQVTVQNPQLPEDPLTGLSLIQPQQLRWRMDEGVTLSGRINGPQEGRLPAQGRLQVDQYGLSGSLTASGTPDNPVISAGDGPVRILVTNVEARFPEAQLSGSGSLGLFGDNQVCEVGYINLERNRISTDLDCEPNLTMYPVPDSEALQLGISSVSGTFNANWENDSTGYDIDVRGRLAMSLAQQQSCGARTVLNLSTGREMQVRSFNPKCPLPNPAVDLGFVHLLYRNLQLDNMAYSPSTGDWDFTLTMDGRFRMPAMSDLQLPTVEGITLTPEGFEFPEIDQDNLQNQGVAPVTLRGMEIVPRAFSADPFTFPWFTFDGVSPGPWSFSMDLSLRTPAGTGQVPACFSDREVRINDVRFSNGTLRGSSDAKLIQNCTIPLGGGSELIVEELGGSISGEVRQDSIQVEPRLDLYGRVSLGEKFACEDASGVDMGETALHLNGRGILTGSIRDLEPPCSLIFGPFEAQLLRTDLIFSEENGRQQARLEADAELSVNEMTDVTGSVIVDLMTGEIIDADFQMDEPFTWNVPQQDPALRFRINQAEITEAGFHIDGRNDLMLPDTTIRATFDHLWVDFQTMLPDSGEVIFDQAFAFQAGIDTTTYQLDYEAVSPDDSLTMSPGLLMSLAGTVKIDSAGLRASGTSHAALDLGVWSMDSLRVSYHNNFALSLQPFRVFRGRADFTTNGRRVAYVDPTGFNPVGGILQAAIPNRIPLPDVSVAYLQVKENGQLLVNSTRLNSGAIELDTKPNSSVRLVLPGIQGTRSDPPEVQVTFSDLRLDPKTYRYISGSMTVSIPQNSPGFDLNRMGIPFIIDELALESRTIQGNSIGALFLDGRITLFDRQVGNQGSASVFISGNNRLQGSVDLTNLQTSIPLVPNTNRVVIALDSLNGSFDVPLPVTGTPSYQLDMGGGFRINDPNGGKIARADLGFRVSSTGGFSVTSFDTTGMGNAGNLDLGPFALNVDHINNLSLSYSDQQGFSFNAGLDLAIRLGMENGKAMNLPMKNVEIGDEVGIIVPRQQLNSQTTPAINVPPLDIGVLRLDPLAFRMPRDTLDFYNWSPGDVIDWLPAVDFAMTFPGLQNSAPDFSQASVTINNASFQNGVFTGDFTAYTFQQQRVDLPVGGGVSMDVDSISGGLRSENGQQEFDIRMSGSLGMPDMFQGSGDYCEKTSVTLGLRSDGGVEGSVNNFLACGYIEQGPLRMTFPSSSLSFAYRNESQSAELSGTADARIGRPEQDSIEATGMLTLDLIDQEVESGQLTITGPFTWHHPPEDSLFAFTVQQGRVDSTGLVFSGSGSLDLNGTGSQVNYSDLTISLKSGKITDGNVTILNDFAMDIGLGPVAWSVADTSESITYDPGLRLTIPGNIQVGSNGMLVNGQSSADLFYMDTTLVSLRVDYHNFLVGFGSVHVDSGRADLMLEQAGQQETRVGWYDKNGFHADNVLGAAPVPDTLGLPRKEIAYVVLRDKNGNMKVQSSNVSGGTSISTTSPVPLVLASLADGGQPPRVSTSFQDLVLNSSNGVSAGSIAVDLSGKPLDLSPHGNYPLYLTGLQYSQGQAGYELLASLRMKLPQSLDSVPITVDSVRFSDQGFEQAAFSSGKYTETHSGVDTSKAIVSETFSNDAFGFHVRGASIAFGNTNEYKFSGDFTSDVLEDSAGTPSLVHYFADYKNGNWEFSLKTSHLPQKRIPMGQAYLELINASVNATNQAFAMELSGTFGMPDVLSKEFALTVKGLRIGTDGVSVDQTKASGATPQKFSLFNGADSITVQSLSVSLSQGRHLYVSMDGEILFYDRNISFTGLQIGTDGSFGMAQGEANLLSQSRDILSNYLTLDTLKVGVENDRGYLRAAGTATLPKPYQVSTPVGITVDTEGQVSVSDPDFDLSNNPPTASVGNNFASLKLTGFGLDIQPKQPEQTALLADADLTIDQKTIEFGKPGNRSSWGIRYQYGQKLEWNITNTPKFEFDTDFLTITIDNVGISNPGQPSFGVSIDGIMGLTIDQSISSSIQMEDFSISADKVDMGRVTGGSLDIMGFVSIEVGSLAVGDGQLEIKEQAGSKGKPGAKTTTINTQGYFVLKKASIDIGKNSFSFSGGVDRVLYYKTSDKLYLNVDNARISLRSVVSLTASMKYVKKSSGFKLMVAGGGTLGGSSLPIDAVSLAAMGYISTLNDQLEMGVFVMAEVSAGVPIFPPVVSMTGFGGGVFINPDDSNFQTVADLAGFGDNYGENARTPPWQRTENEKFAVMGYASMSIVGQGSASAYSGEALLMITNQFFSIDVVGYILNQENSLEASSYLQVTWSGMVTIGGGIGVDVKYSPVVRGEANVDFQLLIPETGNAVWAVEGRTRGINILEYVKAEAELIASPDGFYFSLGIDKGFDVWVISIHSNFDMELWWIYQQQFGAYAEIGFNAKLFGGAASLGGDLKGALIIDQGFLFYAAASGHVQVVGVFNGNISVWVAIKNGNLDGGKGSSKYDQYIKKARAQARSMDEKMSEATRKLENMEAAPQGFSMSKETTTAAGRRLLMAGPRYRVDKADDMTWNESRLTRRAPQIYRDIASEHLRDPRPFNPSNEDLENLRKTMNQRIESLSNRVDSVQTRLSKIRSSAIQWQEEATQLSEAVIQTPVERRRFQWNGDQPPEFEIDSTQASQNSGELSSLKENIDLLEERYEAAIDTVTTNIGKIDQALSMKLSVRFTGVNAKALSGYFDNGEEEEQESAGGLELEEFHPSANHISEEYSEAASTINKYYASYISKLWMMHHWASSGQLAAIYGDSSTVRQALYSQLADNDIVYRPRGGYVEFRITGVTLPDGSHEFTYYVGGTQTPHFDDLSDGKKMLVRSKWNLPRDREGFALIQETISNRVRYVLEAHPDSTDKQATDAWWRIRRKLSRWKANDKYGEIGKTFVNTGMNLWVDAFAGGYEAIIDSSKSRAQRLAENYDKKMDDMEEAHVEFTNLVDDLYDIKADMSNTLYGMLQSYANWRESVRGMGLESNMQAEGSIGMEQSQQGDTGGDLGQFTGGQQQFQQNVGQFQAGQVGQTSVTVTIDTVLHNLRDRMESLKRQMATPVINDITLSHQVDDFRNRMTLSWDATHPAGDIVENSYSLNKRGAPDLGIIAQDILSAGSESEITRYAFREGMNDEQDRFTCVVRVRGPAGNTISRTATFSVPVDEHTGPGGGIPGGQSGSASGKSVMDEDDSPPSAPIVSMDYEQSTVETMQTIAIQGLNQTHYTTRMVEESVYWTSDSSEIVFTARTFDFESDISEVQYAIGTTKGGTDVRDWTTGQGKRLTQQNSSISNWGGTENFVQKITAGGLHMEPFEDYYLSVRSINGAGDTSDVTEVDDGIQVDQTPPTTPGSVPNGLITQQINPRFSLGFLTAAKFDPPDMKPPAVLPLQRQPQHDPEITFRWKKARDKQSGIHEYEYVISDQADAMDAFQGAQHIGTTSGTEHTVTGDPLSFQDSVYVHIRAVNSAGVGSKSALTYGPILPRDPTPPTNLSMNVTASSEGLGYYLVKPSWDPESKMGGTEYAIGTNRYNRSVQSWTELESSFWETALSSGLWALTAATTESQSEWPEDMPAPNRDIPSNGFPKNQDLWLKMRTMNRQEIRSDVMTSGPIVLDDSPPPKPEVSMSKAGDEQFTLSVTEVGDPQSRIIRVEYKVRAVQQMTAGSAAEYYKVVQDWTELSPEAGEYTETVSYGQQFGITTGGMNTVNYDDLQVKVRITNTTGMQTITIAGVKPSEVSTGTGIGTGYGNYDFEINFSDD